MKTLITISFLFFTSIIFAQNAVDTIHCGEAVGYGKMLNGKKEGPWIYKLKGSTLFSGSYLAGQKTGQWINMGFVGEKRIVQYQNNLLNGPITVYDGKKIILKGTYSNGLKNGEWDYYLSDGKTISQMEKYQNGVPCGRWKIVSSTSNESWSGEMNAYGRNGYWIHKYEDSRVDSGKYVNGKEEGYWKIADLSVNKIDEGNFVNGKKEGRWTTSFPQSDTKRVALYKNGLQDGYDSSWVNDQIAEIDFYVKGKMCGEQKTFSGRALIAAGNVVPNPQYKPDPSNYEKYEASIDLEIDLIENNVCNANIYRLTESANVSPQIRDSLIQLLSKVIYVPENATAVSPFSTIETVRSGPWLILWENGNKKEEGTYLPIAKDSMYWDSTSLVGEDTENGSSLMSGPVKTEMTVYYKTGWWKYYSEEGVLTNEERYNEKGELVEVKKH